MLNLFSAPLNLIRQHRRAYIVLNVLYYGVLLLGMAYVAFFNPGLQSMLLESVGQNFSDEGLLATVGSAYGEGRVFQAMWMTFVTNLLGGSFLTISLPGLVIPFSGLLMGLYRAVLWGLLLSPSNAELAGPMIPHSLTLLLEGQAYVVTMLGVYLLGRGLFKPQSVGADSALKGYWAGLKQSAVLYVLVIVLLAVAAVYEALEVIYLAPLFA